MDARSAFLIELFEKLGAPLMAAVAEVNATAGKGGGDPSKDAEKIAELLGKSVQSGIALTSVLNVKDDADGKADSVRLSLAAVSAGIVADHYKLTKRAPSEKDLESIRSGFTSILSFAENFASTADNASRLKSLGISENAFDEYQINAVFFQALVPVLNSVSAYSFGRQETKLFQEITEKLVRKSAETRKSLFPDVSEGPEQRQIELALLHAFTDIYVECHKGEMTRLMAMNEEERQKASQDSGGALSMAPVWDKFETRAAMLEVVAPSILPGGTKKAEKIPAPPAPAAPQEQPADAQQSAPPSGETPAASQQTAKPSIFAKPKDASSEPPQPQDAPSPATQPPPSQPPEPEKAPASENTSGEKKQNPMAFFKKKEGEGEE